MQNHKPTCIHHSIWNVVTVAFAASFFTCFQKFLFIKAAKMKTSSELL